ncbi:hypothetical protein VP01_294g3 [Puccinia sorghi]|uniref:Uncharacterized protein n=1 Tax=Puccinia sorghi TaxID=27349 RepID=A0A0L6V0Z8_9BASI|nr:hypothetical protein VP01_294g3 [Puccinia sorghi]
MIIKLDDWMIDAEGVPSPSFYYFPASTTLSCLDDIHQVSDGLERLVVCLQAQVLSALGNRFARLLRLSWRMCGQAGRRDGKLEYDALINDAVDLRMKSAEEEQNGRSLARRSRPCIRRFGRPLATRGSSSNQVITVYTVGRSGRHVAPRFVVGFDRHPPQSMYHRSTSSSILLRLSCNGFLLDHTGHHPGCEIGITFEAWVRRDLFRGEWPEYPHVRPLPILFDCTFLFLFSFFWSFRFKLFNVGERTGILDGRPRAREEEGTTNHLLRCDGGDEKEVNGEKRYSWRSKVLVGVPSLGRGFHITLTPFPALYSTLMTSRVKHFLLINLKLHFSPNLAHHASRYSNEEKEIWHIVKWNPIFVPILHTWWGWEGRGILIHV